MASSSSMVGPMKSQAMPRSERPRMRRAILGGVASAIWLSSGCFSAMSLIASSLRLVTLM